MIVLALIGVVTQMAYSFLFYGNRVFTMATKQSYVQQNVRLVADYITREVRSVKAISTNEDIIKGDGGKYYSLKLKDEAGQLYMVHETVSSSGARTEKRIGSPLTSLLFLPSGTSDTLRVTLTDKEVGNKDQDYDLEFKVLLNNINDISIPSDGVTTIYFNKYE